MTLLEGTSRGGCGEAGARRVDVAFGLQQARDRMRNEDAPLRNVGCVSFLRPCR